MRMQVNMSLSMTNFFGTDLQVMQQCLPLHSFIQVSKTAVSQSIGVIFCL